MTVQQVKKYHAWRLFLRLLKPYRWRLFTQVLVALMLVGTEGLGLGAVLVFLGGGPGVHLDGLGRWLQWVGILSIPARIRFAALALIFVFLVRSFLQYLQGIQGFRLRRLVEQETQLRLISALHCLPLGFVQKEKAGGLLTLIGPHVNQVGWMVLLASQNIAAAMILLACLALALAVSVPLTLFSILLLAPIIMILRPLLGSGLRTAGRRTIDLYKVMLSLIQEHLAGLRLIHLFDRRDWSLARARDALEAMHDSGFRADRLASRSRPAFMLLLSTALAVLMVMGSFFLDNDPQIILSSLAIFLGIAFRLLVPMNGLAAFQAQLTRSAPLLEEIEGFLATAAEKTLADGDLTCPGLKQAVVFHGISFRYAANDPEVLQEVDLRIPAGKTTALVGASGAGKSTVVNLLTRLYDPSAGQILIDGVDLRRFQVGSWRQKVAVVGQEVYLFHASVSDNLRFARPEATAAEIVSACQVAQIHDFIVSLPRGYDTVLEERGMRLSGGQRQRLALARALLVSAAELLVLDEATSELDRPTEEAIYLLLAKRQATSTLLVVTHHLSAVRHADRIMVLEKGRVAEEGTQEQLLANGGAYARLARMQAMEPVPDGTPFSGRSG